VNCRGDRRLAGFSLSVSVIRATVLLVSVGASARDHKRKASDNHARLVAHVSWQFAEGAL
jgi:hypothetical protein